MQKDLSIIIQTLHSGGVIAHPADTCYGLAGDFTNKKTVERIQKIKGRDAQKPMSIMLPLSIKAAFLRTEPHAHYALLDDFAQRVCEKLLPGPVTLLLPKGPAVPKWYYPDSPLIGIRIPDDKLTQEILEAFGSPLTTTSANLSGEPPCLTGDEVKGLFEHAENKPDLIVDGSIVGDGMAATVILVKDGKLEIVRKGAMSEEELERKLQD